MTLPEVKEITRWSYRPGDRLICHTDIGTITREQAHEIAGRIRAQLGLPEDAPIVIAGTNWSFEVISGID